jgi:hypothetical protein
MILSKEQYYKRRWFLAILFLLMGFWLLYLSYGLFFYNKSEGELIKKTTPPAFFKIENVKISGTPMVFLTILNNDKKISSLIDDTIINNLSKIYNLPDLNRYSFGNELYFKNDTKSFKYSYAKDKLYELKIDEIKVLTYKKKKPFMAYIVLIIALGWISFQVWVLYILKTKGIKAYDK